MTKRLFSLSLMIFLAIGTWADNPVAINKTTLWTFGGLETAPFTETPYAMDGLYACGHSTSKYASIVDGSVSISIDEASKPTNAEELAIFNAYFPTSAAKYLNFEGGSNTNIALTVNANTHVNDRAAFYAGVPGTVYAYVAGTTKTGESRYLRIYEGKNSSNYNKHDTEFTSTSPFLVKQEIAAASNVFIGSTSGKLYTYAILFIPAEKISTPSISYANGQVTISGGASSTSAATAIYYTTDGSTPSATNGTVYSGAFNASDGTVVKAISVSENGPESFVAEKTLEAVPTVTTISERTSWTLSGVDNNTTLNAANLVNWNNSGLFLRSNNADGNHSISARTASGASGTFSNGTGWSATMAFRCPANSELAPSTNAANAETVGSKNDRCLAFNVNVAGTVYVAMKSESSQSTRKLQVFFNGNEVASCSAENTDWTELRATNAESGTYYIGGTNACQIAYILFIPGEMWNPTTTLTPENVSVASVTYNGTEQTAVVKFNGTTDLVEGTDYDVSVANSNKGINADNYTFSITGKGSYTGTVSDLTFTINKATLTATADDQSKTLGEANPELAVTVTGFVNEETASTAAGYVAPTATTTADANSPAGTYDITVSGGSATNYIFNYVKGTLTVNAPTTYDVSKAEGNSENVSFDKSNPTAGETVTITVTIPYDKRIVGGKPVVCKTDDASITVEVTQDALESNRFTFTMPAYAVTVSVEFEDIPSIYGIYDFQTWAEANISTNAQSLIVLDENGYMTGTFTPSGTETINGTMTLNDAFSITGTSYRLRKNGSTGNANSGLMIAKTGGAKLTINRLKAGDWFTVTTDVADRLQFATSNTDVHPAGSTETITQNSYVQSGTVYIATAATTVDVYSKDVGTVYIHSIQISNEDAVSAPTITVDGGNQVTIDGGTSLKGNPVTVYYTTDNTDPVTSETKQVYTAPFTLSSTVKVRAYSVLTSDNTIVSAEATPAVVRVGTWTGEQNVFDFASAAANYVDITFGETAVSDINGYNLTGATFYPITNTDWLTATDNTAVVAWRNGTGNAAFENGGLISTNQKYFVVKVNADNERVKILFDGGINLRSTNDEDFIVLKSDGSQLLTGNTIGGSSKTNTEETLTVQKGGYVLLQTGTGTVIKKITVLPALQYYTLTTQVTPSGQGMVTVSPEATKYVEGTEVTLTATPESGYEFSYWTVDGVQDTEHTSNTLTLTMDAAHSVTAAFKKTVEKTVGSTKSWTFNDLEASTVYNAITAIDNEYYLRGSVTPNRTFTVTECESQALTFSDGTVVNAGKYLASNGSMQGASYLTGASTAASVETNGDNNALSGAGCLALNTTVPGTLYAMVSSGTTGKKLRVYFADGTTIKNNEFIPTTTDITEIKYTSTAENGGTFFVGGVETKYDIYAVRFVPTSEAVKYTLTLTQPATGGTISAKVGDETITDNMDIAPGTDITLVATPATGYQLGSWKNGNNSAIGAIPQSLVTTMTMPISATTITAEFTAQPTEPTAITTEKVWIFDALAAGTKLSGAGVYEYEGLYIGGHNATNYATVTAGTGATATGISSEVTNYIALAGGYDNDIASTVTANTYKTDAISFKAGVPGTVAVYMSGKYAEGRNFNIWTNGTKHPTAMTDDNALLVTQSVSEGSVFIATSTGAAKVYAIKFIPAPKYTLTTSVTPDGKGSITYKVEGEENDTEETEFYAGTTLVLTATSTDSSYGFSKWTDGTNDLTAESDGTLKVTMDGNKSVYAVFEQKPSYALTISFDANGGTVTDSEGNPLNAEYMDGSSVTVKATAAEGYQFVEWTDADYNRLTTLNEYTTTIAAATTLKAVFKQPTSPAPAITTETIWKFDDFTVGTKLSGTKVYEYDGLYISGHNSDESNQAQVMTISPAVNTTIAGELSQRLRVAGKNNSIKPTTNVADFNADAIAFMAGNAGVVTADVKGSTGNKYNIYIAGELTQVDMTGSLQLLQKDVTAASSVFISSSNGGHDVYAVKFTPEVVTAPVISVSEQIGTMTEGTSNLTDDENKVIKTYYTVDGTTEPTAENGTLYEGVIMASGTDITVKAVSVNTVTGVKSAVTTETGLTLSLPSKTFNATVGTTGAGTVTWKKAGTDEAQAGSYEQGTSIEVTATATGNYMFLNWTKGDEVVAMTPTYTFTLMENTELVANFKDMGNTVPVILTAGQSNTDGRVPANELPTTFTGLENCYWSYCNAKQVYAGSAIKTPYTTVGNLEKYSAKNDNGGGWAYDAVVYNKIGEQLGQKFYVIKQSKGNTGISPASGGNGLFWSANPLWLSRNESANNGGRSLLKALIENIDASLTAIETESGKTADIKFLMWHQGEGDGNGSQGPVYYTQLKALINYVRNHLAAKNAKYSHLPFILGGITSVSAQYNADVEAAKQQLASEDANIYYVDINEVDTDGLLDDVLHFNATGAQTLGNKVWQTIYENNLMAGLAEGTGSSEPVADILTEATPVTNTTKWDFSDKAEGTAYAEKTNVDGMYLHGSSSNKMTVKAAGTSSVSYSDGESVSTTMALRSASGDRSKFMTNGLTAGDAVAIDRMIGVNTNGAGTFYAVIAPETQPTTGQESRELYLLFNGEKVATINALEAWNASDDHTIKLKYAASEAGTFFLTGQHPYLLYAAKFVKAGEETGGFTLTTIAEGGTITMTAPEGKTLNSTFSKGEEVTLKATADEGYALLKWTDGADNTLGSSENLTITMNSDMTVKAVFISSVDKPTISKTYTVNDDSYTYTLNYMEGATLHYTLPGGTEQTVSGGVSIDVNVTVIGDLTAYATCGNLTSETLTSRVYGPTQKIENGGVYDFSLVKTSMIKDYTLGTIGYGDEVTVGNMTLYKPDAVVSKTLDRFAFAPKLNESGKNAADWMLLSAGRLRAKSSDMTDYLAILDVKQGDYVKITYSGGAELRYVQESTATLIEGTNVLTSGQAYEAQSDGVLLLTVPANESNHCDITNISITNVETVSAPTLSLKDNTTNVVRLRQGSSSFGKTVTTYYTTDRSVPSESNGTAVTKSPYEISLESTSTVKAITISETGVTSDVTSVTFVIQDKGTTEEVTEIVTINDDNTATVFGIAISEGATAVTISGSIDGALVTSIADNTFTAANTANVAAVDLSETAVTMTGNREEIPALKNINEATLVYLPSTANVTGTNVVTKSGENFTCADFQLFDGHQGAVPHSFTAASAILNRVFTADKKCTVCLPYPFTATGGTYYKFTGISSSKVQMTAQEEGTTLDANTPYIFVPSSGTDNISASNVEVSISGAPQTENAEAQFTFIGTYEHIVWDAPDGIYGFAAEEQNGVEVGQFVRVGSGASIDAYRAYLKYTGNDKLNGTANAARRTNYNMPEKLQIEWIPAKGSADTTSIETTVDSSTDDMPVYNISGQRVNHNYKGMVIKNGKKMINK